MKKWLLYKWFSFHNWYRRMTRLLEGWNLEDWNRWREWLLEEGLWWKWLLYNGNLR
ncbi:hypothetical protein PRUPE_2G030900 [Prunus persica]|uniref:Uncharacterized protein n=1 Tax=Prunus persica TaxID=3760 RepID=A0A251QAB8_PRUPE|nr:hypothetical protein PRUPE_2G030900 [Prunus persica]